ncbi:SDR family oxidoreductase [Longimicrobium sp.]|uniref:NAD(P)-dependent oxidoreductase n=1 Tax=Longimicrobium sp. TaxID=2029185 RepID=UPI002D10142C|nr:SDR family oxidoreductase [Longimicrobium sp.]HSU13949.1 SDR family oxidoreductase [Longimicrobium sp.]
MNLVVFGASGGTGRELVKQALGHAHTVRAFVRNPDKLKVIHHRLEVVQGDVTDRKAVAEAIRGQDAVLSALGVNDRKPNTVLSDGVRNILASMKKQKVRRLIFVSSLGVGDSKGQLGPLYNWILLPSLLKNIFADKEKAEELIREASLDWTIVRPGSLNNGRLTAKYRTGAEAAAKKKLLPRISRADVADFMLHVLERNEQIGQTPAIRY